MPVGVLAVPSGCEVDPSDDPITEVRDLRDAGVDHRDRHAAAVDAERHLREPDRLPPREVGLEVVVRLRPRGSHVDGTVDVQTRDRTIGAEQRQAIVRHLRREPADQRERPGDAAADGVDQLLPRTGSSGRPPLVHHDGDEGLSPNR